MAKLEILNLTKRFGPVTAVNGMTLDIADGEFFVLLGPNGAGKTTTLRWRSSTSSSRSGRGRSPSLNVTFRS
jgi:ABC-type multidrug transport system ATPase subunit